MTKYYAKIIVEIEADTAKEAYTKAQEMGFLISIGMNKAFVLDD